MKVKIKEQPKEFRPVTMEITFESREEMVELWHRLNAPMATVREEALGTGYEMHTNIGSKTDSLWETVDTILENL